MHCSNGSKAWVTSAAPHSTHSRATFRRFSSSRPLRANRAPSLANRTPVPAPIPELAPVIRATLPLREDTWNTRLKLDVACCPHILTMHSPTTSAYFKSVAWSHEVRHVEGQIFLGFECNKERRNQEIATAWPTRLCSDQWNFQFTFHIRHILGPCEPWNVIFERQLWITTKRWSKMSMVRLHIFMFIANFLNEVW